MKKLSLFLTAALFLTISNIAVSATYLEIRGLFVNSDLQDKIQVAVIIEADTILRDTAATTAQKKWAYYVVAGPSREADKALLSLLAQFNGLPVDTILNATDVSIQQQVNAIVPALVDAHSGL